MWRAFPVLPGVTLLLALLVRASSPRDSMTTKMSEPTTPLATPPMMATVGRELT